MSPAETLAVYERAYSLAWHETVRGEIVGQAHERAIHAGIAAVAAAAERRGMLRAAGIVESRAAEHDKAADGLRACGHANSDEREAESYVALELRSAERAIRRAAGGAE